jgi:hypothetical protein
VNEWRNYPSEREAEENELAARVVRAGYLEAAPTPVDFGDIADYLDHDPEGTRAERSRRHREAVRGADMRRAPVWWSRSVARPCRDEWTP